MEDLATGPVLAVGAAVTALLLAVSDRYGYHRDELYFLAAGHHLAWGYPDQPPLVPALARVLNAIAPGNLVVLRTPSAFAAGAVVVLAALTARELGAGRTGQIIAAAVMSAGGVIYGTGHLLSTSTYDLLAWAVLVWLLVRLLRTGDDRLWLVIGVVAGVGVMDSDLVAFLMAAAVVGILVAGPRERLKSPWLVIGGVIAVAMWSPYLAWQAAHSWPELTVSRAIASGQSGTSTSRPAFIPEQFILLGPVVAPVWVVGLVQAFRRRPLRWIAVAYVFLVVVFEITGAKSYYLAGMFPVLVAAAAQPTADWLNRKRHAARLALLSFAIVGSIVAAAYITLPLLPASTLHSTGLVGVNYDMGETIAWPTFVKEIASAYRPGQVIVASNYGEAGAVDRFGKADGLPKAYSVQDGFWYWGPPPPADRDVLAIGFDQTDLAKFCTAPHLATTLDNHLDVNDDEQDAPVWDCSLQGSWATVWPTIKYLG
jgi:4-amino-4-deoxy-L-arabinose transferase-like glycosyltransferase